MGFLREAREARSKKLEVRCFANSRVTMCRNTRSLAALGMTGRTGVLRGEDFSLRSKFQYGVKGGEGGAKSGFVWDFFRVLLIIGSNDGLLFGSQEHYVQVISSIKQVELFVNFLGTQLFIEFPEEIPGAFVPEAIIVQLLLCI